MKKVFVQVFRVGAPHQSVLSINFDYNPKSATELRQLFSLIKNLPAALEMRQTRISVAYVNYAKKIVLKSGRLDMQHFSDRSGLAFHTVQPIELIEDASYMNIVLLEPYIRLKLYANRPSLSNKLCDVISLLWDCCYKTTASFSFKDKSNGIELSIPLQSTIPLPKAHYWKVFPRTGGNHE